MTEVTGNKLMLYKLKIEVSNDKQMETPI